MSGAVSQSDFVNLRRDVDRLLAIEAIRGVITAYARACDRGNDPVALRPLFTDDAVWECKGFGRYQGGERVVRALKAIAGEKIWWSLHYMISPAIELAEDGVSATAFWYLWEAATLPHEDTGEAEACMIGATYEASLRSCDGAWRFAALELILNMASPLSEGWVRKRMPGGNARQPYFVRLEAGAHTWCGCGRSAAMPLCDRSRGADCKAAIGFTLERPGDQVLCGCRYARTKPFCDGAHLNLKLG